MFLCIDHSKLQSNHPIIQSQLPRSLSDGFNPSCLSRDCRDKTCSNPNGSLRMSVIRHFVSSDQSVPSRFSSKNHGNLHRISSSCQGTRIHVQALLLTFFSEKIAGWPLGNSQGRNMVDGFAGLPHVTPHPGKQPSTT